MPGAAVWSYTVPTIFALSVDSTVEAILSDTPFNSVGLLGFGVFTFLLLMKRVNLLAIYIFASVLVAFVSVIFDLSQLLARGSTDVNQGIGLNSVAPLITLREVGLALSIGLRYLYFWTFVSSRPKGEERSASLSAHHSASWVRLGYFGLMMRWALLAMSLAIPVLQILWRIVPTLSRFGPVYDIAAALEISVSVLFMVKLVINTTLSTVVPTWVVLRYYSMIFLALLFAMGIAIGNLLVFAFSETTLGRFLQALQLYLLVLFTLLATFYTPTTPDSESPSFKGLPVSIKRGSTFDLQPPSVSTPHSSEIPRERPSLATRSRPQSQSSSQAPSRRRAQSGHTLRPSRGSLSSWLMPRRLSDSRSPYNAEDERLWVRNDVEQGLSPTGVTEKDLRRLSQIQESPMEQKQSARWMDPMFLSVLSESPPQVDDLAALGQAQPFIVPEGSGSQLQVGGRTRLISGKQRDARPTVGISVRAASPVQSLAADTVVIQPGMRPPMERDITSSSKSSQPSNFLAMAPSPVQSAMSFGDIDPLPTMPGARRSYTASPVYGLTGQHAPAGDPSSRAEGERGRASPFEESVVNSFASSEAGIDELLLRQQELDRSIAKLKLLSMPPVTQDRFSAQSAAKRQSTSTTGAISLNEFPLPPWERKAQSTTPTDDTPSEAAAVESKPRRARPTSSMARLSAVMPVFESKRKSRSRSVDSAFLEPPRMPAAAGERQRKPSVPGSVDLDSPLGSPSKARSPKFDSQGTQYDVTSFIGGLTRPGAPGHRDNKPSLTESVDSTQSAAVVVTAQRTSVARPTMLSGSPPSTRRGPSPLKQSGLSVDATAFPSSPNEHSGPHTGGTPVEASQSRAYGSSRQVRNVRLLPVAPSSGPPSPPREGVSHRSGVLPYISQQQGGSMQLPSAGRGVGLPGNPRPGVRPEARSLKSMISGPRPLGSPTGRTRTSSTSSGTFERPRPPPLILKGQK